MLDVDIDRNSVNFGILAEFGWIGFPGFGVLFWCVICLVCVFVFCRLDGYCSWLLVSLLLFRHCVLNVVVDLLLIRLALLFGAIVICLQLLVDYIMLLCWCCLSWLVCCFRLVFVFHMFVVFLLGLYLTICYYCWVLCLVCVNCCVLFCCCIAVIG